MAVESSRQRVTQSTLIGLMQTLLEPLRKESPPPPQPAMGFFTDTSLCIGCKACEVACKQWNQLPAKDPVWTGSSYDNTGTLSAITWRHVQFIEQIGDGYQGERKASPLPGTKFEDRVAEAKANGTVPQTP